MTMARPYRFGSSSVEPKYIDGLGLLTSGSSLDRKICNAFNEIFIFKWTFSSLLC